MYHEQIRPQKRSLGDNQDLTVSLKKSGEKPKQKEKDQTNTQYLVSLNYPKFQRMGDISAKNISCQLLFRINFKQSCKMWITFDGGYRNEDTSILLEVFDFFFENHESGSENRSICAATERATDKWYFTFTTLSEREFETIHSALILED